MPGRLHPLAWPILIAVLAAALHQGRVRHEMADFQVYRTAASRALAGEPLYRADDGHFAFKYLPAFAFALAPLGLAGPEAARAIWFGMSVGLLMAFVRWSIRGLPERRRSERALACLAVLLMAKFYAHELTLGQTNLLLGALLVAALLAAQIDLPVVSAVLVAAATFVKPYALVLVPWLAVTYGAPVVLVALSAILAGLLAPAVVYGWTGNLDLLGAWYRQVTTSTGSTLLGADNISLAAMWAKWIGPTETARVLATASAVAALGLAAAVWRRRARVAEPAYLEIALLMLLIPLLSPQGWDYVLLLATPAVVCVLDRWREMGRAWQIAAGTALALMGLTFFDVMGRTLYGRFMALSIVTVCGVTLAFVLARLRWRALA